MLLQTPEIWKMMSSHRGLIPLCLRATAPANTVHLLCVFSFSLKLVFSVMCTHALSLTLGKFQPFPSLRRGGSFNPAFSLVITSL